MPSTQILRLTSTPVDVDTLTGITLTTNKTYRFTNNGPGRIQFAIAAISPFIGHYIPAYTTFPNMKKESADKWWMWGDLESSVVTMTEVT